MPIYEYQCGKCGHEFERDQRITDDPVKKCPSCRSARVKRLISVTSFVLKGGGWYSDLYASGKAKSESKDGTKDADTSKETSVSETPSKEAAPAAPAGGETKPATGKPGRGKGKATKTAAA
jgi:putative FmdB family regulatory protein